MHAIYYLLLQVERTKNKMMLMDALGTCTYTSMDVQNKKKKKNHTTNTIILTKYP